MMIRNGGDDHNLSQDVEEQAEEDYMSMTISEPIQPKQQETYTQRRLRKTREAEARGRTKSKAEREADEAVARDAALSKSPLADPETAATNKGLAMMSKMGFTPGSALGNKENMGARTEPVGISMKEGRGGIGMDTEKRRKFSEQVEKEEKRVKADEGEYRERVRREREEVRLEGLVGAAMRVAERMDGDREETKDDSEWEGDDGAKKKRRKFSKRPLKQINLLWRGLVRGREEKDRNRRMRYDLAQSVSRLPTYDDPNEEQDEKIAMGKDSTLYSNVEDLEEEDPDLDAFNALEPAERLQKLVEYLRNERNYCFWCKYTYPDKAMEGCPGTTEESHD